MTSILRALAILGVAYVMGSALALETPRIAADDSARAPRHHQQAGTEEARNDNGMQALCREVLVDTDEGYGVTSRESRVVCEDAR